MLTYTTDEAIKACERIMNIKLMSMSKVVCIDDKHWHNDSKCPDFGEVVTIETSFTCPTDGDLVYTFIEYPPITTGRIRCFSQKYFAPLSDIDETELVTEEFNEKYCVPVNR